MAQRIQIDKKKNPEAASVVADLEVGARVEVITTIAAQDDQTLTLEVEEVVAGEEDTETAPAMEDEETDAEPTDDAEEV